MSRKKSKQRQSVPDEVRAEGSGPVQVVAEPSKKKFSKKKGPKPKHSSDIAVDADAKSESDEGIEASADDTAVPTDSDEATASVTPTAEVVEASTDDEATAADFDDAERVVEATASVADADETKSKRRRKSGSEVVEASADDNDTAGEAVAAADVTKSKRRRKSGSDEVVEASAVADDSTSDTAGEVVASDDAPKSKRRRKSGSDEVVEASAIDATTSDDLVSADAADEVASPAGATRSNRRRKSGKTDVAEVSADDASEDAAILLAEDGDGEAEQLDADHADAEPLHADGDATLGDSDAEPHGDATLGEQRLADSDDQLRAEADGAGDDSPVIEGDDVVGAPITDEAGVEAALLPGTLSAVQLRHLIEALIFATDKPVTLQRLRQLTRVSDVARIEAALAELQEDYKERGIALQQVSGGYQFRTNTAFSSWVQQLIAGRPVRLSRAQLETLAIVAYRQPITRPEIDEIRGVDSSNTLRLLLERSLIRVLGKREEVGRPTLYGTTKEFLDFFSLGDLRELPTLREYSELTAESRQVMSDRLGVPLDANGELVEPELAEDSDVETPELGNASIVESILAEHAAAEAEAEARYDMRDASAIAEAAMSGATSFGDTSDSDDDAMSLSGELSSFGTRLPASEARSYVDAIRASVIDDEIDDVELSPDATSESDDSMLMPESAEPSAISTADELMSESHMDEMESSDSTEPASKSREPHKLADEGLGHSENPHVETPDRSATDELVSESASSESTERGTSDLNADAMSESHEPHMADRLAHSENPHVETLDRSATDELVSESHEPRMAAVLDESTEMAAERGAMSMSESHEPHMADGLAHSEPHEPRMAAASDESIEMAAERGTNDLNADAMSTAGELMSESHEPHMADGLAHSENPHVETPDSSASDELVSVSHEPREAVERETNHLNAGNAMTTTGEPLSESPEPHMADASSIDVETSDSPSRRGDDHELMTKSSDSVGDAMSADELMSEPHEADSSDETMLVSDASIDSGDPHAEMADKLTSESSEPHMADKTDGPMSQSHEPHESTLAADASVDSGRPVEMADLEPNDSNADDAMTAAGEPMVESHEPRMADAAADDLESIERVAPHSSALADSGRPHVETAESDSKADGAMSTVDELMSESREPHMADASDTSVPDASTADELMSESHEPHMADADTMLVAPDVVTAAAPEDSMIANPHVETADAIDPNTPDVGQTHLENPDHVESADDTAGSMRAADVSSDSGHLHVETADESIEHKTPVNSENPHVETRDDTDDESTGN